MDPYLTSYTKINSEQIKDINVKPKTTKLLEENTGQSFKTLDLAMNFGYDTKDPSNEKNRQIGLDETF